MSVVLDASSPIRWAAAGIDGNGATSASFTAPANALLVVTCQMDTTASNAGAPTIADSGGLTWTKRVERTGTETTAGGYACIWTARTTSSAARTITVTKQGSGNTHTISAKCYVLTGVDVDGTPVDTVGASNEGGSTTNSMTTTSITPGATGLLIVSDCEWNQLGAFQASSDLTQDTADYSGEISACSGYKTCASGVGVTANLNAAGTSAAQHKWCQIVVREASATLGPPILDPVAYRQAA